MNSKKQGGVFGLLAFCVIVLTGVVIYSNSYQCSWHFDDLGYIVNNPTIRSLTNFKAIWEHLSAPGRTVVLYSFALNYYFGKTDIYGYHLFNNITHIINALLVFWMAQLIFRSPKIKSQPIAHHKHILSIFIALVFLTHPLQTQAVTYICQRFASVATLFYLAAINFYLTARLRRSNRLLLFFMAGFSAVFGMFSKQIVITLPLSIILIEGLFISKDNRIKHLIKQLNWKYVLPVLLFILIIPSLYSFDINRILSISHPSSGSYRGELINSYYYSLTQLRVVPTYIRLLFLPIGQNLLYDFQTSKSLFEIKTFLGLIFILVILALACLGSKRKSILTFSILWFFITLLVESSVIPIRHVIFEHRVYLPSVGFAFFLVCGLYFVLKEPRKVGVTLCLIVLTFSYLTYQRNKVWLDEFTLWADVKQKSPHKMRPYLNMGIAYSQRGEYDKAIHEFNGALDKHPNNKIVLNNKGIVYTKQHLFDNAIAEYNKALKKDPKFAEVLNNRGDAYRHKKEYELALADYNQALNLKPSLYRTLSNRGVVYSHLGRNGLALKDFNRALDVDPDFIEAYQNRGNLFGMTKQYDMAIQDFSRVLESNNNLPEVYNNRGNAYRRIKDYKLALEDYNQAIVLDPAFPEGYNNRGVVYRTWKKYDLALADYNKAIQLNPDYVNAYNNRGNLFKMTGHLDLAIKDFNTALGIDPENPIIYVNRAQTLVGKKQYTRAYKDAQKAKSLGYSRADQLIKSLSTIIHEK